MLEKFLESEGTFDLAEKDQFMLVSNLDEEEEGPDDEPKDDDDIDKGGKTDA